MCINDVHREIRQAEERGRIQAQLAALDEQLAQVERTTEAMEADVSESSVISMDDVGAD